MEQQGKLRSILFELISAVPNQSYANLLATLMLKLQENLNFSQIAIYVYNNWDKTYEMFTNHKTKHAALQTFTDKELATIQDNCVVKGKEQFTGGE